MGKLSLASAGITAGKTAESAQHVVGNMGKAGMRAVSKLGKTSLNVVDQFLSDIEPQNTVIRSATGIEYDAVDEHVRERRAYKLQTNIYWHWFVHIMIALNAVQMGLYVEITGSTAEDVWTVCDHIFTAIFAVDMIVALLAFRLQYFYNSWNYLDFAVANIAILDTWLLPLVDGGDDGGLSSFRVFRLLKLLRLARLLEVIPELKMVVQGLFASIKAMAWILLLLVIVLYTAGIFCTEIVGGSDAGYPSFSEESIEIERDVVVPFNNYLYFGSIARSMITLFNMVVLAEWQEILRPVAEHQPAMVFFFVCIIFLCAFGVLNVMIGIVVENTNNAMREHEEKMKLLQQKSQIQLAAYLADMVFTFDQNDDQRISLKELINPEHADELYSVLGSLGLPYGSSLEELFEMLDVDGNGFLSKLEFVQGIMRLIYCDQFQRDCLFRTAIGQVKQAVAKSMEHLKQSFTQELQETRASFSGAVKQLQQGESCAPCELNDTCINKPTSGPIDGNLPEISMEREGDGTQSVYVRVVDVEEIDLEGPWSNVVPQDMLLVEASDVSKSYAASWDMLASGGPETPRDVKDTNRGATSDLGRRKKATWDGLQKSLVLVRRADGLEFDARAANEMFAGGLEFDARAANEMFGMLSRRFDVLGWMPVVRRIMEISV